MSTHGLPGTVPGDGLAPLLAPDVAALRVELSEYRITAVSDALTDLTGRSTDELVGLPLTELWPAAERAGIARRFENAVLLGRDSLGMLSLPTAGGAPMQVEAEARFLYQGGQRLEVVLTPVGGDEVAEQEPPASPAGAEAGPAVEPEPTGIGDGDAGEPAGIGVGDAGEPAGIGVLIAGEPDGVGDDAAESLPAARATCPEAPPDAAAECGRPGPDDATNGGPPGPDDAADDVRPGLDEANETLVLAALEAADAGGLWVGADGRVIGATRAAERLLGAAVAGIRGRRLEEVVALAEAGGVALAVARAGRVRQSVLGEATASGTPLVVEWVPGRDPDAGFAVLSPGCAEADSGETDRLRLQAQLAAHVAHDLRDSMAAVFCGLQLLADEFPPDDTRRRTVDQALDDSRRANRIIDEVLAVSRPGRLKRLELDLGEVVAGTVARYRLRAAARSVEVREQITPGLVISADKSALERAFGNIVDNALQATPHLGVLTVIVAPETRAGPGARVSIADTGTGIPRAIQPNVFDPFVTNRDGGSGLGLAITRRIVIDHGGQIDFESEEGRGTTFHVWLPCSA